jgi:hypothetical protein
VTGNVWADLSDKYPHKQQIAILTLTAQCRFMRSGIADYIDGNSRMENVALFKSLTISLAGEYAKESEFRKASLILTALLKNLLCEERAVAGVMQGRDTI